MISFLKKAAVAAAILGSSTMALAQTRIEGAGATFPNPIYQKWVTEYQKANTAVAINYNSIGSGGGIKAITDKTVDFAGSDAPLSKKEKEGLSGPAVHIPTVAGSVVPAYNLPGVSGELKLTGELIAEIFMGKVSTWNDAKIKALNPNVNLPSTAITPVWRTDGSGTTFVFTNYLATQSPDFKSSVGASKQVKWPAGQGGKGNEGVAAVVQSTPGALGYIESNYAVANNIPFAAVKNKDGQFVKATPEAVSAAGAGALEQMDKSLAVDIWNQPGAESYPISAFTYIIVYEDLSAVGSKEEAQALVGFLNWAVTDGQKMAGEMAYAPLADGVAKKAQEAIASLKYNGQPLK